MHFQWSSQAAWKTEWFDSEVISTKRPAATSLCLRCVHLVLLMGMGFLEPDVSKTWWAQEDSDHQPEHYIRTLAVRISLCIADRDSLTAGG